MGHRSLQRGLRNAWYDEWAVLVMTFSVPKPPVMFPAESNWV